MSVNSAGEIMGRFYEDFGTGNIDAALSACAEDLDIVDPGMGHVHGRDRFREYLETFKRAMPDARAMIEQTVESGETVAVEGRFTGTHTGPLATDDGDVEPTGATVDLRFADVSRVRDGRIVAYHTYYDQVGLLTQLGLMGQTGLTVDDNEPPAPVLRIGEMSDIAFVPAAEGDRVRVIATLVSAFVEDPVERWLFPEPTDYLTHFPVFVAAFGGDAFSQQTVWRLGEFVAAAMWIPPGAEPDAEAIIAVLSERVSPAKHEDTFAVLEQMDQAHPSDAHWYLPWLGVDTARRGTGLGSELLEQCLAVVDADHLPAFLETPNPRTIPFYERHGFEVTNVAQAGACPPMTSMLRTSR